MLVKLFILLNALSWVELSIQIFTWHNQFIFKLILNIFSIEYLNRKLFRMKFKIYK